MGTVDGLSVTKSDGAADCYALLNSIVTIRCTYEGSSTFSITGAFWEITPASGTPVVRVQLRQPPSGFSAVLDKKLNQTSLTINQVSQNVNASQVKCVLFLGGGVQIEDGSDMIRVLLGSMKQDLPVMFKCDYFLLSLDCRRSHHIL